MALEGKGRLGLRKDEKRFLYLPKSVVEDSAFPFDPRSSVEVKVRIDRERILIPPLNKTQTPRGRRQPA